ncbi:MAG: FkbM family methyltransferase [Chloroflexi bacterium]|nr:FkbM family methyltransferase [Chloroflexota bacterium]
MEDLYYCYRLLLKREPDEEGWKYWHSLITNQIVTIRMVVDGFLYSDEFRALEQAAATPELIELDDFTIYVRRNDYFVGNAIANEKSYEPYVTAEVRQLLKPGDVFLDIGANIGYFTLLAAALVGPTGQVIAFEPNPDNCDLMRQSIQANHFENIELYPLAAAEVERIFELEGSGVNSNGRILDFSPQTRPEHPSSRIVQAVVLDEVLKDAPGIDLVKMDIEGAEPRAWQGMQKLVEKHKPVIITEFSPDFIRRTSNVAAESFLEAIAKHNYQIFILERFAQKSPRPQSIPEIMDAVRRSGLTHLDLVAYPQAYSASPGT